MSQPDEAPSPADRERARLRTGIAAAGSKPSLVLYEPWELAELDAEPEAQFSSRWSACFAELEEAETAWRGDSLRSPRERWWAARRCIALRSAIEAGDGPSVMMAAAICATHALVMPPWLAMEFVERCFNVAIGDCREWSEPEAFGSLHEKGSSVAGWRRVVQRAPWAYDVALRLLERDPLGAFDAEWWGLVAAGIGASSARDMPNLIREYLAENTWMPPLDEVRAMVRDGLTADQAVKYWQKRRSREMLTRHGFVPVAGRGDDRDSAESPKDSA